MATGQRTRRRAQSAEATPAAPRDLSRTRFEFVYREVSDLHDYAANPRDNSTAIQAVANSIRTFGFIIPVVIDANDVLVAGHTRVAAAKTLGLNEVPTVQAGHLSQDEIDAFRIIDNKVAELAKWDFDLLSSELSRLNGSGLVMTDFGWAQEELDCLTDVVADDCLNTDGLVDLDARDRMRRLERRAPSTARFVCGEIVFFIPATDYRVWVDALRAQYDFNEAEIIAGVKARLGIVEAEVVAATRRTAARTARTAG